MANSQEDKKFVGRGAVTVPISRRSGRIGVVMILLMMIAAPAVALTSVGLSVKCDADNHCVSGTAFSSNAGVNATVDALDSAGAAVATCKGSGVGATLVEITCSIGNKSTTMSFPGSAGAVPVQTSTGTLDRLPVCWEVVGYFPVVLGPQHIVSTGDCALIGI